MSHWYDKSGQLHDVDLKTARKEGYVPSVTEIIYEFENSYGLELYKAKQMFMASLTLPRPDKISDEDFFELVKKDSEEHSEKAKEFGKKFHYKISDLLKNPAHWPPRFNPKLLIDKKVLEVYDWIEQNKDSIIVDFKTLETKDGKFRQPYDSWLFQLCGYQIVYTSAGKYIEYSFCCNNEFGGTIDYLYLQGSLRNKIKLINIMISSNEDIPIKVYEWKSNKIEWGCQVFNAMLNLYKIIKKL